MTDPTRSELTFDPVLPHEWRELQALGERMLGEMFATLATLSKRPAWQRTPDEIRSALSEPVPTHGIGAAAAYTQFVERVLPYPNGSWHPRFFGWVQGNGTPLAMLSDMLASGLNAHLGGFDHAPAMVERQTVAWLAELLGMPGASGLFVTGGTLANTLGLAVGRHAIGARLGRDVRAAGGQAWPGEPAPRPLVFYGSTETHGWARKAAELLGLGDRAYRRVPVDRSHRIDTAALERQIGEDRASGLEPFCVIGTAGTVNIGATDDLPALAAIAGREGLWFHVDGAFGALARLSPALRERVRGVELADSIGFDLHKWGSMPFDCACTLVLDPALHLATFATTAAYLTPATRGPAAGGVYFSDRGIDLTRNFKALKVWMQLKADGVEKLARIVEQNVAQCAALGDRIAAHAELELMAPVPLNIVCFRYVQAGADEARLESLNAELLLRLQERGIAVPSSTRIDGRFAIRVANVNHRATAADFDMLFDGVLAIGRELVAERSE